MIKRILSVFKKIIVSAFILYGYNLIAVSLNMIIPINFITVGSLTILGIPALFAFILIHILIF